MSISHKCEWIWVGIPKTATSTLQSILHPCDLYWYKHETLLQTKEKMKNKEQYEEYWKFSFVRNPYDKTTSFYRHMRQKTHVKKRTKLPFDKWLEGYFVDKPSKPMIAMEQIDCLCDETGELKMDFIGRFENLAEDIKKICNKLNIKYRLPHYNRTVEGRHNRGKDYRSYYNSKTKKIITKWFERDLDIFKYTY